MLITLCLLIVVVQTFRVGSLLKKHLKLLSILRGAWWRHHQPFLLRIKNKCMKTDRLHFTLFVPTFWLCVVKTYPLIAVWNNDGCDRTTVMCVQQISLFKYWLVVNRTWKVGKKENRVKVVWSFYSWYLLVSLLCNT